MLHALDESEQICDTCGSQMVRVGEEFVRTEVQFIPAKLKVIDHYRETYECRSCRKKGKTHMEKAPVPYPPVMHFLALASTIAWLIHQKFKLGIPLYRQEKEWRSMGLALSRSTISNWLLAVYRDWLQYIVSRLKKELLNQKYLHIDETHVQVMNEPGRKNTTDSYLWVYCSLKNAGNPVRYFEYQPGRGGKYPEEFLKDYTGYIHTDAPVSSMDSGSLFVVASLTREMIAICYNNYAFHEEVVDDHIRQFFCMTHNPYFFREISYNRLPDYECVSFFEIKKDTKNQTSITECQDEDTVAGWSYQPFSSEKYL